MLSDVNGTHTEAMWTSTTRGPGARGVIAVAVHGAEGRMGRLVTELVAASELERSRGRAEARGLLRGGVWRNYLVHYPESNLMEAR